MELEKALTLIDTLVCESRGKHLNDLQTAIIRGAWEKQTYEEIAATTKNGIQYVKLAGAELFKLLSEVLEEDVDKRNFKSAIERKAKQLTSRFTPKKIPQKVEPSIPQGQIRIGSPFYLERPIEARCYQHILQPGEIIRICAPKYRGKSSLMVRILEYAATNNYHSVTLDF